MTEYDIYSLKIDKEFKNLITEFDNRLWVTTIDNVVMNANGTMVFQFKDGSKREWGDDK